jgi:serine/threonine protein kinase/Flp pilus assembly protein TadD
MTEPERHCLTVFGEALECASSQERAAYLDCACGQDTALRARVEELLQAHQEAGGFLQGSASGTFPESLAPDGVSTVPETVRERVGAVIGPYKLLEQIGEGGFGIVFLAEQTRPLRRKVALKILKPGMDTRQVVARFEAERQALALMDHPNIAHVFDGGETAAGRPYFVMELVKGVPITRYCDQNELSIHERLELFACVCQAVQHAHQKGIIHRDLKPSNVLVASHDGVPVVKVIDFGIAKATGQSLTDKTLFTHFAQMIGTPLYMSPEQAGMSGLDVDTRSDIYSLGVVLYELLTGTTPFDRERLRELSYDELRRIIREEEPPRPSTRVGTLGEAAPTVSANRQIDPKRLSRLCRGELDWIVMRALEKDRNRRYESASAFAADVERFLRDEPVLACPPSTWYRLKKFARRNRAALAMAAVILVATLVLSGGAGWALQERAGRRARQADAVDESMQRSVRWQDQSRLPEALAEAHKAQAALAGGDDQTLRRRVEDRLLDLETAEKLELIRLQGSVLTKLARSYTAQDAEADYARAIQALGIDVEALDVREAADRIRSRTVPVELAEGLFQWATLRHKARPGSDRGWEHLLAVARAADPDSLRNRVRDALASGDRKALTKLVASERLDELPPATLVLLGETLRSTGEVEQAVALLRRAQRHHPQHFWVNYWLAFCLRWTQPPRTEEAVRFYSAALALRPENGLIHLHLGLALAEKGAADEALAAFERTVELLPENAFAHVSLGVALEQRGRLPEAAAAYHRAIELKPGYYLAHSNLGNTLARQRKLPEAVARYREAARLHKKEPEACFNLGDTLERLGKWAEAADAYRDAIKRDPGDAAAHAQLGRTLVRLGKRDEAVARFREAIRLRQDQLDTHFRLIMTLVEQNKAAEVLAAMRQAHKVMPPTDPRRAKLERGIRASEWEIERTGEEPPGLDDDEKAARDWVVRGNDHYNRRKLPEAAAAYQEAIDRLPRYAAAHLNLANTLLAMGQLPEALAAYRRAIAIAPNYAEAHGGLGMALGLQGKLDEAVPAYLEAIKHKPGYAPAHVNLGLTRVERGEFAAALADLKRGHALLAPGDPNRARIAEAIRRCTRLVQLDARLPAVLRGEDRPADNKERLAFVEVCRFKDLPAAAARLYEEAFTQEPGLAADLRSGARYSAACAAAKAGCGRGKDRPPPDDVARARWRRQARDWLRADLGQWGRLLEGAPPQVQAAAAQTLRHWQRNADLQGVRDVDGLARLPKAERDAWLDLWADVETLRARVQPRAKELRLQQP